MFKITCKLEILKQSSNTKICKDSALEKHLQNPAFDIKIFINN